ncbi:MAG: WG repeat-containing protein, partial [Bacteroidota bacterium]
AKRTDILWGLIDREGQWKIPPQYQAIQIGSGNQYLYQHKDSCLLTDEYGITLRMQQLTSASIHQEQFTIVDTHYGQLLLDRDGNSIFPIPLQKIQQAAENRIIVSQAEVVQLYDRSGQPVLAEDYSSISPVPGTSLLMLYREGEIRYLDPEGHWLTLESDNP